MKDVQLIHYPNNALPPKFYEIGDLHILFEREFANLIPGYFKLRNNYSGNDPSALDLGYAYRDAFEKYWNSNVSLENKIAASLSYRTFSLMLDEDRQRVINALSPARSERNVSIPKLLGLLQDTEAGPMVLCTYDTLRKICKYDKDNNLLINTVKLAQMKSEISEKELKELIFDQYRGEHFDLQKLVNQDLLLWQPVEYVLAHVPRVVDAPKDQPK